MRVLIIFSILFCSAWSVQANVVGGYMILAGQDTVLCKIKIAGKKQVTGYSALVIVTETGEEKVFRAIDKQVVAFGFNYMGVMAHYRFAEIKKTYESGFFRLIDNGKNYKLYVHIYRTSYNGVIVDQPHYVVFKPNGEYVDLTTHALGNWKKNLKHILRDNPEALKAMENVSRTEIDSFIRSLNK